MRFPNDLEERFMKEQSSRIAWALSIQSVVATSASLIGCCLLFIITRNPVANTGTDTEKYFYVIYEGSIRVGLIAGGLSCMAFAASLAEIHYPLGGFFPRSRIFPRAHVLIPPTMVVSK